MEFNIQQNEWNCFWFEIRFVRFGIKKIPKNSNGFRIKVITYQKEMDFDKYLLSVQNSVIPFILLMFGFDLVDSLLCEPHFELQLG